MNISLDGYGGNRGYGFLLEFCSVTAANGILCVVEEIGRISSSHSPGKQGPIYREIKRGGQSKMQSHWRRELKWSDGKKQEGKHGSAKGEQTGGKVERGRATGGRDSSLTVSN